MLPAAYQVPAAALLLIGGCVACFAGYRLFKFVLGLFGFVIGVLAATSFFGPANTTPDNLYMIGTFRLDDGDALVIDLTPPEGRYWSVTLDNIWHECIDRLEFELAGREPDFRPGQRWGDVHPRYVATFGPDASSIGPPAGWQPE